MEIRPPRSRRLRGPDRSHRKGDERRLAPSLTRGASSQTTADLAGPGVALLAERRATRGAYSAAGPDPIGHASSWAGFATCGDVCSFSGTGRDVKKETGNRLRQQRSMRTPAAASSPSTRARATRSRKAAARNYSGTRFPFGRLSAIRLLRHRRSSADKRQGRASARGATFPARQCSGKAVSIEFCAQLTQFSIVL